MDKWDKFQEASWTSTVDVWVQVSFTKIHDVDTINQRFQAEAMIESKWHDPNVKCLNESIDSNKIWKPDLYVENALGDVKEEVHYKIIPEDNDQLMIYEIRRVRGVFYENLELENFPLDVQDLTLFVSTKKSGNKVNLILLQPEIHYLQINHTLDKSMWEMHNVVRTCREAIIREFYYGERKYPGFKVTCQVFRSAGFFYWNCILPILLVSFASLCPFVIDPKIPQSRLPSTATMLLTTVSIRWIIGRLLPTVSYLTFIDKYSLGTMMIITLQLIYHATMGATFPYLPEHIARRADKIAFGVFVSLVIFKQIALLIWIKRVSIYREKLKKQQSGEIAQRLKTLNLEKFSLLGNETHREEQNLRPIVRV